MRTSSRIFFALAIVIFFSAGLAISQSAWSTETCTVTGKATNAITATKGQDWDYLETTCGNLGVQRWPSRGHDIIEQVEVGKTYRFGINGFSFGWQRSNIVSFEEVQA